MFPRWISAAVLLVSASVLAAQSTTPSFDLSRDTSPVSTTATITSMVTGDFNNDARPDLVMAGGASANAITLRLGNGDGTFQAPLTIDNGNTPYVQDMAAADVNNDGNLDLIVSTQTSFPSAGTFTVYLGNGNGTFQAPLTYSTTYAPDSIAVADLNGDGYADIAVGDDEGFVELWNNQGGKSFTLANTAHPGNTSSPVFVRAGQFNGHNGINHLAALVGSAVYVLWNDGHENFTPQYYWSSYYVPSISVGDLNLDGKDDIVIPFACSAANGDQSECGGIQVLYGEGQNQVTSQLAVTIDNVYGPNGNLLLPGLVLPVDVNGDGIGDLVAEPVPNQPDNSVTGLWVYTGKPDGAFTQTPVQYVPSTHPNGALVAADFNRDGMMDFAQTLPGDAETEIYINGGARAACSSYTNRSSATVCQPVNNTWLPSPVTVQANSYDTAGVTAMQEYIDNSLEYNQNVTSFTHAFPLSLGSHFLVTKAWDSTGAAYVSDRNITVYSGTPGPACAVPSVGSAAICLPAGTSSGSSVQIVASGWTANVPTAAQLYIDGDLVVNNEGCNSSGDNCDGGTSYVSTAQSLSSGTHDLVFKLWDNLGKVCQAQKTISVQ